MATGPGIPTVSIVRLDDYDPASVAKALDAVLEPLGGMTAFAQGRDEVILKPNFLKPAGVESAVNTHPGIMRSVARSALASGAKRVVVTDSPAVATAAKCARKLGIDKDEPFSVEELDDPVELTTPDGRFKKVRISKRILDSRSIINLAKAKTHGQMTLTLAVKNMFGAVLGLEKAQWHLRAGAGDRDFARLLVQIYEMTRPNLNLLDAVIAMEGNGPGGGDPRKLGLLLASTSGHALDAVFCRIVGIDPRNVPTLDLALGSGLLCPVDEIRVIGPSLDTLRPDPPLKSARPLPAKSFGPMPEVVVRALEQWLDLQPSVDAEKCTACGECVKVCAANAMAIDKKKKRAVADKKTCISCFCCQEICPEGAITVQAGWLARVLGLGTTSKD